MGGPTPSRERGRHDQSRSPQQEVRPVPGRGRRHVQRPTGPGHRLPRAQRGRQVHDHARDGRPHPTEPRHGDHPRSALCRPPEPGPRGGRPPRRLRAARRSHRPRDAPGRRPDDGSPGLPRRRDAGARRPRPDRSRPPGPQLLPRDAPAARHRHRAARRARGTDPRRARQRARPRGHPMDAGPAPRLRRPGRDRPAVLAPPARDRGDRRRPGRDRPGPDRRRGHQDRPALRRRARSSGAVPSPSWRAPSPSPA